MPSSYVDGFWGCSKPQETCLLAVCVGGVGAGHPGLRDPHCEARGQQRESGPECGRCSPGSPSTGRGDPTVHQPPGTREGEAWAQRPWGEEPRPGFGAHPDSGSASPDPRTDALGWEGGKKGGKERCASAAWHCPAGKREEVLTRKKSSALGIKTGRLTLARGLSSALCGLIRARLPNQQEGSQEWA